MKFTVTPLGGGRADTARVVDSIVRYLQPPTKNAPSPSTGGPAAGDGGAEQYYADRARSRGDGWVAQPAIGRAPV